MDATIKKILSDNAVTISLWIAGVAFAGLNLYIATQLAPLAQNLAILATKVEANEKRDEIQHPTFATKQDISDIKEQLRDLNTNLNKVIWSK
jgi:hypothetical protein